MHVKLVLATVAAVVFMGESPLGLLDMVHANPLTSWQRPSQTSSSHRDVEAVEPVRRGGSRSSLGPIGPLSPASSDEDDISVLLPIGFGSGIRGLGFGGRPLLPTRDSDEDSSEESGYGAGGYLHPFFIDPMTNFMAQMAEMVADMRRQMSQVLAGGTDISKLGNTTSTTKVVDGHIITVNETVVGGEDGVDLVHIRIIDVQPMESSMPTDANSGESGNKEGSKNGSEDDTQDGEKDAEALSSVEATGSPNRSENEIPIKVGSEVDDLNA